MGVVLSNWRLWPRAFCNTTFGKRFFVRLIELVSAFLSGAITVVGVLPHVKVMGESKAEVISIMLWTLTITTGIELCSTLLSVYRRAVIVMATSLIFCVATTTGVQIRVSMKTPKKDSNYVQFVDKYIPIAACGFVFLKGLRRFVVIFEDAVIYEVVNRDRLLRANGGGADGQNPGVGGHVLDIEQEDNGDGPNGGGADGQNPGVGGHVPDIEQEDGGVENAES